MGSHSKGHVGTCWAIDPACSVETANSAGEVAQLETVFRGYGFPEDQRHMKYEIDKSKLWMTSSYRLQTQEIELGAAYFKDPLRRLVFTETRCCSDHEAERLREWRQAVQGMLKLAGVRM